MTAVGFTIVREGILPDMISGVVGVHRRELNHGFLSSLGDRPLSLLFECAAASRSAVLLVALGEDRRVLGFLLGTFHTGAFYKDFLRRKGFRAALVLLPVLASPRRVYRILETLLYPRRQHASRLPDAELLDIAVLRECQGAGVGQALFKRFCAILHDTGVREFRVTTGESLPQAHRFYERLGARRMPDIEVHKGQTTRVYVCSTDRPGLQPAHLGDSR